jgi:MraZ protein
VFTGEYRHTVDEKGRIAVPARFRARLAEGSVLANWIDGCLAIFPRSDWDRLGELISGLPFTDPAARQLQRFLYGGATEIDLDRQGRFVVPANLREYAGLRGDAVIVGSRDHAEIWAPDRWTSVRRGLSDPDALAELLSGLGI